MRIFGPYRDCDNPNLKRYNEMNLSKLKSRRNTTFAKMNDKELRLKKEQE